MSNTNGEKLTNSFSSFVNQMSISSQQITQSDTILLNNKYYAVSNDRNLLSWSFLNYGLIRTIVAQPVEDAFRGGIIIKSNTLSADDINELNFFITKENVLEAFKNAIIWARLFGGGGLVVEAPGEPNEPLMLSNINQNTKLRFVAADLWELFYTAGTQQQGKPYAPNYDTNPTPYNYYGQTLHNSRVIKFMGDNAPSLIQPTLRGWGASVLEAILPPINQYMKAMALIFELLDEAKIDVYKIKGFNERLLDPSATDAITKRVQLSNILKNFQQAIVMDTEDDFSQKVLSVPAIAEMLQEIRTNLAANICFPQDKLFGYSASGFSSGADVIENYNGLIESGVRMNYRHQLITVLQLCCRRVFDMIPDDLEVEFYPLRTMSPQQEAEIKDRDFNRIITGLQNGLFSVNKARELTNSHGVFNVNLDTGNSMLQAPAETLIGDSATSLNNSINTSSKYLNSFKQYVRNLTRNKL